MDFKTVHSAKIPFNNHLSGSFFIEIELVQFSCVSQDQKKSGFIPTLKPSDFCVFMSAF